MRRARVINALVKGVLDPRLIERIDLAHYYTSVRTGRNVVFRPQGGFRLRSGSRLSYPRRLRRRIEPIHVDASMITAGNGGTSANLVAPAHGLGPATIKTPPATVGTTPPPVTLAMPTDAPDPFTTSPVGSATFLVCEIDLGAVDAVCFVDVVGFRAATGSCDDCIAVEWWTGTTWESMPCSDRADLAPRKNLRTAKRTRRFGGRPGWVAATQHVRIVAYAAIGAGAISIDGLRLWRETPRLSPTRPFPFTTSLAETLEMVAGDRNVDVFDGADFLGSIPLPIGAEDLDAADPRSADDTVFLWHEDFWTPRLVRQGQPDEWNADTVPYDAVPQISASTAFSDSQSEIQTIVFPPLIAGQSLVLFLEHARTQPIVFGLAGDLPGQIEAALEALPGFGDGIAVALTQAVPPAVRVTFGGANANRRWPKISALVIGGTADCVTAVVQRGIKGDGALMEPANGWPRCGLVHQGRLIAAGTRAAPKTLLFSELDSLWSFDPPYSPALATKAIEVTLDSDQRETIHALFVGRHLQVFTEAGEWWSDNRSFDATSAVNMILATRYGLDPRVAPTFVEASTVFLGQPDVDAEADEGPVLRGMSYTDILQNYDSEPLNIIGPHLLRDVAAIAVRKARAINKGSTLLAVNGDGSAGLLTILRSQEVLAMSEATYADGALRQAFVDFAGRMFMVMERNGDHWLERADDKLFLDAVVGIAGAGLTSVDTPHMADGEEAWAVVDGDIYGPLTVAGGAVALPVATLAAADVGKRIVPDVHTNPLREKLQDGQPFRLPARIYEVELSLMRTGHVCIGANGQPIRELPLRFADGAQPLIDRSGEETVETDIDTPEMGRLFTGRSTMTGLSGWSKHPSVRVTQVRPSPLEVRAIRFEASA